MKTALISWRTPSDTSKLGPVLARRTTLLLPVVVTVAAGGTVCAIASSRADGSGACWPCGLFVCGGDNFAGEVEPECAVY